MPIHYDAHDDGHIALITIDRPETRNALDLQHFSELANAWRRFRDDDDAWVAIITGVGDSFCAGADLKTFIPQITDLQRRIREEGVDEVDGIKLVDSTDAVLRGFKLYKPVIAAVNGHCVAGGMEMLGGVDIRLACQQATFGVLEPRHGLFAGGGTTVRLPRQIAFPHAMELLLTADRLDAQRCYEMGLVNEVVDRADLRERAFEWARRITRNAPLAVQATKESVMRGLAAATLKDAYKIEMELSGRVFTSEDAKEGPRAFAEKREPQWQGR